MVYISSFTYCDKIQTEMTQQGPQRQIVTPLQVLMPIALPGNFSFSIAFSIAGFDATQENKVNITFSDQNNNILYDTGDVNFNFHLYPKNVSWYHGYNRYYGAFFV